VRSQHEIELAVEKAIASGAIRGSEPLQAAMTLKIGAVQLEVTFDGRIELQ